VAYTAPGTMQLGSTARVEAAVSLDTTQTVLLGQLTAPGVRGSDTLRVSPELEATLVGMEFQVTPITPARQPLVPGRTTHWTWDIKATVGGPLPHPLHLVLSAKLPGRDAPWVKTYDREIRVEVSFLQQAAAFVEDNWKYVMGTLILPLLGWLWKKRQRPAPPARKDGMNPIV
jgi:hypothetical protein